MKNQRLKLIIGLVVIGLLLFSVIFSRLRHKNYKTSHKDDVEVTISRDDVTEEEIEEFSYTMPDLVDADATVPEEEIASMLDALQESGDNYNTAPSSSSSSTEEATTEQASTETSETSEDTDGGDGYALNEDKASQEPVAKSAEESQNYWTTWVQNSGVSDDIYMDDRFIADIIKGNLLGYIQSCPLTSDLFRTVYSNGFFADIADVEISELNYDTKSCLAKVTFNDGSVKNYSVVYKYNQAETLIEDIICTEQ